MGLTNWLHIKMLSPFSSNYLLKACNIPGAVGDRWLNRTQSVALRNFLFSKWGELREEVSVGKVNAIPTREQALRAQGAESSDCENKGHLLEEMASEL